MRGIDVDGNVLRKWRKEHGITQEEFAAKVSCDIKTISNAERSKRLDASMAKRIADALGLPLAEIIVTDEAMLPVAERNRQLFHDWQAAFNNRDVEALVRFYHEDATITVPGADDLPGGGEFHGTEAIREHFIRSFDAFEMEKLKPDQYKLDAAGDHVFARATPSAVVRSTGQKFIAPGVVEFEIRDGKIQRHSIVVDTAPMRRCWPGEPLGE